MCSNASATMRPLSRKRLICLGDFSLTGMAGDSMLMLAARIGPPMVISAMATEFSVDDTTDDAISTSNADH